ncbi:ABC transporter ATP-binding protein [Mycolicibacterium palauense]|uniref:ABC transporter ATP-binding protein n=1 Tax=Mycolicibacterium palauense TaxID=2034511 RepID=UPI000BFECC10|nr:ABC transporter ATP-binding protein [Mycolicibacterium palauense]
MTVTGNVGEVDAQGAAPDPGVVGLRFDAVSKVYPGTRPVVALEGIDISIAPGSFTALLGPSGCGKSTLLRMAAGLEDPTEGSVSALGQSPRALAKQGRVSISFQDAALLPWRTVEANIRLPLESRRQRRLSRAERDRRIHALIAMVGLEHFANAHPDQLSGGMQQRVAIARSLAADPDLLLLDEPFGALDEITRLRLNLELQRIWSGQPFTTLLVTHSVEEAVILADRVIVMSARPGRVVADVPVTLGWPRSEEVLETAEFARHTRQLRHHLMFGGQP